MVASFSVILSTLSLRTFTLKAYEITSIGRAEKWHGKHDKEFDEFPITQNLSRRRPTPYARSLQTFALKKA